MFNFSYNTLCELFHTSMVNFKLILNIGNTEKNDFSELHVGQNYQQLHL